MDLLRTQDLTVSIKTASGQLEVINDIAISMSQGEKLGIVGESGCGKSITALAIMSLLPFGSVARGKVLLMGEDLLSLNQKQLDQIAGDDRPICVR